MKKTQNMKLNKILFRLVSFFMVIATMVPMLTIKQVFGQEVEYKNLPNNFTVRKVAQDGKPLSGAIFEFRDAQGKIIEGVPRNGEEGVIDYPITTGGNHTLKEIKAPTGYVADTKEYTIPIGVPFTVPQEEGRDVSDKVVLLKSSSQILNPSKREGAKKDVIYPNEAVGLELTYSLDFVDDLPDDIQAGDYFTVKLSDNYDPSGISPIRVVTNQVSLTNELGVIAEASYDETTKTIKYTFTDYVDTFKVLSGTTSISGYVDRVKVKDSNKIDSEGQGGEVFGYTIGDPKLKMTYSTDPISVDYREKDSHKSIANIQKQGTLPFQSQADSGQPSIGSLVTHFDQEDGRYTQIIYVNPIAGNKYPTEETTLRFHNRNNPNSTANMDEASVNIYKVPSGSSEYMPHSFYLHKDIANYDGSNPDVQKVEFGITRINLGESQKNPTEESFTINFGTVKPEDSYVIVVKGKIDLNDKTNPIYQVGIEYDFKDIQFGVDLETNKQLDPLYKLERFNTVKFTPSSSSADGEAGITIVNSEKIDISAFKEWGNLEDAEGKEILLKLFANGEPTEHTVTLNGSTDSYTSNDGEYYPWRASFGDLPAKDKNGKLIEYSVKEYSIKDGVEVEGLDGFKTTYAPESVTAETFSKFITVTNEKEEEKVTIVAEKEWQKDGQKTESNAKPSEDAPDVYFQLMNGESIVEVPEGQSNPVQYSGKTVSWENLPKVDPKGNEIQYTIKEVDKEGNDWKAPGYTVSEPTVPEAVPVNPDTEEDETQPKTFIFINNYETTSVKVTKKWTNVPEDATKPDVYFQLMKGEELVGDPKQLPTDSTEVEWTNLPKVDTDGNEIQYTVKEVDKEGNDWKADNYTSGNVTAVEGSTHKFTIENIYEPKPGDATITATKALTGRELADGEFEFVLTETTEGVETPHTETVTNVGGNITFSPIHYDKAGTYTYTITEAKGELPGVTYDETAVNVTVVVTDKEGKLETAVTYENEDSQFENAYTATPGEATITATKVITGRELANGEFEFVLTETTEGVETPHTETVTNVGGNITFSPIHYDKAGTYTYTITEAKGELPGVTYDETAVNVTVDVTDNNGTLETAVTYENGDSQFENTYKPADGSLVLEATKVLTGKTLTDQEFNFVVMEGETQVATGTNDKDGKITFSDITYTEAGEHTYTVKEVAGNETGMTYDKTEFTVSVKVEDAEGQLVAKPTYPAGFTFNNSYQPINGSIVLEVSKILTGRDLKADEFSFELINADGKVVHTVSNQEDGKVTFPAIPLSEPGEFTYKIKEVQGSDSTVKYDDSVISATFKVSDQNGQLVAGEVVYSPDAVFENIVEEITTTEESTTSTTTTTTTEISTTTTEEPTTTTKAPEPDLYDVSIKKVDQHGNAVEGVTFELYQIIQTMVEATSDSSVVTGEPVSVDTSVIDMEIETLSTQIGELKKQIATLEAEQETTIQSEASESLDSDRLITIESLNAQIVALEDQLEEKLTEKSAITINTTEELAEKVEEVKVGTYTTDKSGLIQVSGLVEGEYYFVETAAPVGYDFTNKPYYFSLPKDKSLLFTITNLNNNTTTVEDTTTTLEDTTTSEITTTVEDTTTSEITTTVEDTTTSEITTTVEDTTTSEITTTAEDTTTSEITTTVGDTTTSEITTTVGDTTTSESTTTVEYFTTAEDTTTTEETPVPSGETTVSGGTPGDNDSTPNKGQDNNKHLPHTGESIMSQIVLPTIGFSLLAGGFLIFSLKNGYKL